MYVAKLRLWNFRRFGSIASISSRLDNPDIAVSLHQGLNAIIGANDAGKSAIIDSLKIILTTHSTEWNWLVDDDFYGTSNELRIECEIAGFTEHEAKNFIEWLTFDEHGTPYLKITLNATRSSGKGIIGDTKAGAEGGSLIPAEARSKLKTIYMRPLRDAKNELIARKNSRLSQILSGHDLFKEETASGSEELVKHLSLANDEIRKYFGDKTKDGYEHVMKVLEDPLGAFFDKTTKGQIDVGSAQKIKEILEKLILHIEDHTNPGLGTLNRLFIATELLLFLSNSNDEGSAHIALVEELEAHLHPQAQLKVAKYLQNKAEEINAQMIITTHSPTLASKLKLESLILCVENESSVSTHNLGKTHTKLAEADYAFLERFLDATKANLFFARGVIIVEGDAENILLPSLASKINMDFTDSGVSIVNVGSTAYMRYAKIFQRQDGTSIPIKVAVIADLDIKPPAYKDTDAQAKTSDDYSPDELQVKRRDRVNFANDANIKSFVSPAWTLEYCLALSPQFRKLFYEAVLLAREEENLDKNPRYIQSTPNELEAQTDAYFIPFTAQGSSDEEIAYDIYQNNIKDKVSKAIVAQHFAMLLQVRQITVDMNEEATKYLFEAIAHTSDTGLGLSDQ